MKVVRPRPTSIAALAVFLVVFSFGYLVTVSRVPDRAVLVQEDNNVARQLNELEWRIKSAVSQSNERSRDFVNIRNEIENIFRKNRERMASSLKPVVRAPSSVNQPIRAVEPNITANQLEQLRIELLPGMSHLRSQQDIQPAFELSKKRRGVSIAIGIPTVKRDMQTYLLDTIDSLLKALTDDDKQDVVITVMIAEWDIAYVRDVAEGIKSRFLSAIDLGLLEIISPPQSFYPSLDGLTLSFGDDHDRVRWRTKQNLDYAFMMMYARNKGRYYLQLEDDILSTPSFVARINGFVQESSAAMPNWVLLEFSALGFIGKLFHSSDLYRLASFFMMFHKDKPIDWLLDHFLFVKVCHPEHDMKMCGKEKAKVRIRYKPSLFQHVGQHSSLKGKIQKLKDRDFKKNLPPPPFTNPPARVSTTLDVYQSHTLDQVYLSRDIFWGMTPKKGDTIQFVFDKPTVLTKILILSGNTQHPGDICSNVTIEVEQADSSNVVLPVAPNPAENPHRIRLCDFDKNGQAVCDVPSNMGPLVSIRLMFTYDAKAWVILRQVNFFAAKAVNR